MARISEIQHIAAERHLNRLGDAYKASAADFCIPITTVDTRLLQRQRLQLQSPPIIEIIDIQRAHTLCASQRSLVLHAPPICLLPVVVVDAESVQVSPVMIVQRCDSVFAVEALGQDWRGPTLREHRLDLRAGDPGDEELGSLGTRGASHARVVQRTSLSTVII